MPTRVRRNPMSRQVARDSVSLASKGVTEDSMLDDYVQEAHERGEMKLVLGSSRHRVPDEPGTAAGAFGPDQMAQFAPQNTAELYDDAVDEGSLPAAWAPVVWIQRLPPVPSSLGPVLGWYRFGSWH